LASKRPTAAGWYETRVIDAVVATQDSREMVLDCVERLRSPLLERVVVVDNGSVDGTADALRRARPDAQIVRTERPEGLSFAYNRGSEAGSAELILFLNDDVLVTHDAIAALAAALKGRSRAVAAAGRLVDPADGRTQEPYLPRAFPGPVMLAISLLGRPRRPLELDEENIAAVDQPPGACLLVRRAVFEAVGRWDEDYEFWFEDVDLARRLSAVGEVLFVPAAAFPHIGGASARRLSRAEVVSRHYRGALVYAQRHLGVGGRVITAPAYALASAGRLLTSRDTESRRAYSRVLRDAIRVAFGRNVRPR
jgi:N-acetylglucosaminyl-diphospho-decaprenol L-rhamnosyltransferase